MTEAVTEVAAALLGQGRDIPVALIGVCSGAIIAFEVARTLERDEGRPLERLYVAGQVPPPMFVEELNDATADADVEARLRAVGETSPELWREPELAAIIRHAAEADFAVLESYTYAPMPRLSCPVTAIMGVDDVRLNPGVLRGWADETDGPFDCRVVSGGHLPDSEELAAEIRADRVRCM
jgi:surfactin synthase thioesterase subunit